MRYLASTFFFLLIISVARAQPYHIRVTHNTNLRASSSLEAARVDRALAGATLQVVGSHNRWLKINRNGRELWMADWVAYMRVDGPQTAGASDIDNCCSVNRQCATNQDWVDGYWAYHRGECPAGAAGARQTSTATTSASQDIDNCCFVNRQCTSEQEWTDGYVAYRDNSSCEAGAPAPNASTSIAVGLHPGIHIDGPDRFRTQVKAALDLIKRRSGRWYHYTDSGINRVRQVRDEDRGMDVRQRIFNVNSSTAFLWGEFLTDDSLTWLAGVLVHEACHVYARQFGLKYSNQYERFREEVICQQIQIEALDEIDRPQNRWRQYLSGLINNWKAEGHEVPRSIIDELKGYPR